MSVRRLVAVALVATIVASCGGATSSGPGPAATDGAGSSGTTPPAGAASDAVPPSIAAALDDPSWARLGDTGEDLDSAIAAETGLVAAIGQDGADWLTDLRSTVERKALVDAGVDVSSIGASHFSTQRLAAAGDPRTADLGVAWIGVSIGVPFLLSSIANRIGETGQLALDPVTSHEERTIGDLRLTADSTALFTVSVSGSTVIVDGEISQTTSATDIAHGTNVGTGVHRTHIRAELQACPDAQGVVVLKMQVDITSSTTGALGSTSFEAHATAEQRGQVDDAAELASTTDTLDMTFGTTATSGATQTGSGRRTVTTTGRRGTPGRAYTGTSQVGAGTMAADDSEKWQNFLQLTVLIASQQAFDKAEELWKGGKCVAVEASHQGGSVDPDEIVHFEAWPVHKIDGGRLDKPVVATLNGAKSVLPAGQEQDAPAPVTYVAPATEGPAGTVTLKSTSNRGIGLLTLSFTVVPPVVVELEIDSTINVTKLVTLPAKATAKAEGRIRLESIDADEWHGEGTLISTTTNHISGCNVVKVDGQGVYDWVVFNAVVSPTTAAGDIVVHMDNGTITEEPDHFTLPYCKSITLTGTMNTWENAFFLVHGPVDRKGMGFEVGGWTLKATPDTWKDGGLIAEAHWSGTCANTKVVIPALPSGANVPAVPSVVDCTDDTTFRLWAVVPPLP